MWKPEHLWISRTGWTWPDGLGPSWENRGRPFKTFYVLMQCQRHDGKAIIRPDLIQAAVFMKQVIHYKLQSAF